MFDPSLIRSKPLDSEDIKQGTSLAVTHLSACADSATIAKTSHLFNSFLHIITAGIAELSQSNIKEPAPKTTCGHMVMKLRPLQSLPI